MLTLSQITQNTIDVIKGLEKKHFDNASQVIEDVIKLNDSRKETQTQLDENLSQQNKIAKSIGVLMRENKTTEAEDAKKQVASLKAVSTELQAKKHDLETRLQQVLYTIPNVPYPEVPEGATANDNVVVKQGGTSTSLPTDALPHWELAKKYHLIDFDLGVKITGAGFPVYTGMGARLQRALINFFLDEARKKRLHGNCTPDCRECRQWIWYWPVARQGRTDVSL